MSSGPAVQLSFTLRTSSNVRTVHLLGSWDNYKSQLPLSAVKDDSAKPGSWKGTFRFQGSHALKLGSRYWYYYIIDGYHVSHDPGKEHVTEKTTGRKLNILDVPAPAKTASKPEISVRTANLDKNRSSARYSREIPQGRALSPGRIQCPKPQKPYASRSIREADYERSPIEDLEERFSNTSISVRGGGRGVSPYTSSPSELSDASSGTVFSSSSSESSDEVQQCRCNKVGVTRDGRRVKLDCGGRICGYSSETSDCSSDSESEAERVRKPTKRTSTATATSKSKTVASKRIVEERRRATAAVVERRRR